MNADEAWASLNAFLRGVAPLCRGLDLFTADRLTDDQLDLCASICSRCPVAGLCGAYAASARVQSGFWAGHFYSPKGITTAPGGSRQSIERQDHE